MFWQVEIYKDGVQYYIPFIFRKRDLKRTVVKKQSKYFFQIFVCLNKLSKDGYFLSEVAKSGEYQIQLLAKFVKPKIEIKSNVINVTID